VSRHLRNPRLLGALGFVVLLLLVALWPEAVPVELAPVERGTLRVTVDEEGETRVRDRFVISAPVAGRVLRIELEPGDRVERGVTVLATLDPQPLDARTRVEARAAVAAAEAKLGRARAEQERAATSLALAQSELERQRRLFAERVVSQQALDARQSEAESAAEAVRAAKYAATAAEHERDMARARLLGTPGSGPSGAAARTIVIRSPVDGVVLKRQRESEAVVAAGEPLLEVGDPDRLEIVSDLLSSDAVRVNPGQPVQVVQWGGEAPLRARVRRVEPSGFMKVSALGVEEQRVNVLMDFEDPGAARSALGDAYRVEVEIVVWEGHDLLKVPTSSLFRQGEGWAVFAADAGRARLRAVKLGRRNGLEAQVVSGLAEGDRVVVHPSDALAEGARIAPRTS
jgi:HlyD family secretion protein